MLSLLLFMIFGIVNTSDIVTRTMANAYPVTKRNRTARPPRKSQIRTSPPNENPLVGRFARSQGPSTFDQRRHHDPLGRWPR